MTFDHTQEAVDLVVIGAGPAGMAAAMEAHSHGLRLLVADENMQPGGQVYRAVGQTSKRDALALGEDYHAGSALVGAFEASGVRHLARTTVWMIERDGDAFAVGIRQQGDEARDVQARVVRTKGVIIANGALERPCPVPGWTLPGVMTAGAAQTLLKSAQLVPAGRTVLAGSGPLLYLLAQQLQRAGVTIQAVLDTTPISNAGAALRHLPAFLASGYARKGLRLATGVWRSGKLRTGVREIAALGQQRLEGVSFEARGHRQEVQADTLLLHQGVVPQIHLALSAGCEHRWNAERLAFEPKADAWCESSIAGLYIAGDGGGIGGADAAACRGRIAAIAIAAKLGRLDAGSRDRLAAVQRRLLDAALRGRRFLDVLFQPAREFRTPNDATIVCRCEEITAGAIRSAAAKGAQGPNQIKAFLRAGMGPCQGRLCGLTTCELIAETRGVSPDEVGHMHVRNPVKPITVGDLAGVAKSGDGAGKSHRLF